MSAREVIEYRRIEITRRVDWIPAWSRDVSGMQNGRGKSIGRFGEKKFLDLCLLYPIITKWLARRSLIVGTTSRHAVNPQCSAVNEVRDAVAESVDKVSRRVPIEADQVDHNIRLQIGYLPAEGSASLGSLAVDYDAARQLPLWEALIRLAISARYRDNFVSLADEARDQPRANVPGCAYDGHSHDGKVTVPR